MLTFENFQYELLDCGHYTRTERFGDLVINRPCAQATWPAKQPGLEADVFFERTDAGSIWTGAENLPDTWPIKVGPITANLKFSTNGQVGLFPEQFDNWQWIYSQLKENIKPVKVLNTFAYTGMSTLFASHPHTQVCHVDGAKSAISWAKQNAVSSGLAENHIRWICDDVQQFMAREVRRGNQYDAIILDPPAFGRGAKKGFKIERDLPALLALVAQLLTDKPKFVILTCHAPEHFTAHDLATRLEKIPQFKGQGAERLRLEIPSAQGHALPSSFGARISF